MKLRTRININEGWSFTGPSGGTQRVNLPHTWNSIDGQDGGNDYWRGTCIYCRTFSKPEFTAEQRVYLEFQGVNASAKVELNGTFVGIHNGGYSTFRWDVTEFISDSNVLMVHVDNGINDRVYPQKADFTFYGGIYRDVSLIVVNKCHFDLDYLGGLGIMVTAKPVENYSKGEVQVKTWRNCEDGQVHISILDGAGKEAAAIDADSGKLDLPDVHLWDGIRDPYLYTVVATLTIGDKTVDQISARFGVRDFRVDPREGFFLNGRSYPLRGVSRHQDRLYQGNALTWEDHYEDAALIKELGANTIRLAHYQHSQDFYDACDQLGLVIWAEIPFISVFNKDPAAHDNCVQQMTELIIQNYNHPCICFWGVSNEILIGGISDKLVENHHILNDLAHKLDPTRLTTIAHVSMTPTDGPMHKITDVESYNHYFGWYGGKMEDNGPWFDKFHEEHPDICIGVSEYGCEGIVTYHSAEPACKDYTEEYQALYHEHMAKVLDERPWMWASHVWNMFDFGCAARQEGGVGGRNNKGLMTIDRKIKKDAYYIYKAYWNPEPMIHICGRRYAQRAGETTEVKIYSNQPEVELCLNGKSLGRQSGDKVFQYTVALEPGFNFLIALAGDVKDSVTLEKVDAEPEIYTLPEVKERAEGVANWFKLMGDLDLKAPMEFPEGYYSVKDTMEELFQSEEAGKIAAEAVKLASNFELAPGVGMWDMMKAMTPERLVSLAGDRMPEGFLESLNAKLIKIKKQ